MVGQVSDTEGLRQQVAAMVQEVLRLRGEVELLPSASLPPDAKKVDDRRQWD
jgi:hypothetical protein